MAIALTFIPGSDHYTLPHRLLFSLQTKLAPFVPFFFLVQQAKSLIPLGCFHIDILELLFQQQEWTISFKLIYTSEPDF